MVALSGANHADNSSSFNVLTRRNMCHPAQSVSIPRKTKRETKRVFGSPFFGPQFRKISRSLLEIFRPKPLLLLSSRLLCIALECGHRARKADLLDAVQTRSSTIGFSGAVSGLSADFSAGSSQLMHWRSVRPEMVTTGTMRFPHFGQHVV
jgi:hypothetical protein